MKCVVEMKVEIDAVTDTYISFLGVSTWLGLFCSPLKKRTEEV